MNIQRILIMIARRGLTRLFHRGLDRGAARALGSETGKAVKKARQALRSPNRR